MTLALISCVAGFKLIAPCAPGPPIVNVPPVPGAIVYRLKLSKLMVPTVRSPSSVIVLGAVIFPRKFAMAVGESGTELLDQLPGFAQLPSASRFHCGGAAIEY